MQDLKRSIASKVEEMASIRKSVADLVESLPDNENITRINDNCFTVKLSEVLKTTVLSPEHYDFKIQYKAVSERIMECDISKVFSVLESIIEKGWVNKISPGLPHSFTGEIKPAKYAVKLHPEVIKNLKNLLYGRD